MRVLKHHYLIYLFIILSLILLTLVISTFGWDLKLQRSFYRPQAPQPWFQKNAPVWDWLYHYGTMPAILLAVAALLLLVVSYFNSRYLSFRKICWLVLLTMLLGPGLIINGVLKDHWGRPRPRQVQEFGGNWDFREVWQPGIPGQGKSFPCGHCSMGFLFIVLYFLFKQKNKIIAHTWLIFSLAFGLLIGLARIAQGGHFLSDVLWSGGITYLTATLLYYDVLKIPQLTQKAASQNNLVVSPRRSLRKTVLIIITLFAALGLLVFIFLFSKPVYEEYHRQAKKEKAYCYLRLAVQTDRNASLFLLPDTIGVPVRCETVIQGFGYPKYKFRNELSQSYQSDTLLVDYQLITRGLFYELEVMTKIFIDTSAVVFLSGNFLKNDLTVDEKISSKKLRFNDASYFQSDQQIKEK